MLFYQRLLSQQSFRSMQGVCVYNLLIIGRSGSGKSAATKLLTSNPSIKVANSLKQVTTEVGYYEGTAFEVGGSQVRFRILDVPGLDKINNRAMIRQSILEKLEQNGIVLHAIIYVSSLTQRDTIDENKLFNFLEQLPWSLEQKKSALIPLFTKYDNLVFDSQEDDVISTKTEFKEIFEKYNYHTAWAKRIYWINHTKSLDFKIKNCEDIKQKYEKQIERLIEVLKKNKNPLTAQAIRETIDRQDTFILKRLFENFQENIISFKKEAKSHEILLKVQVQPVSIEQSVTAVSASSIAIAISKVCLKEVATSFSLILMTIPIAITLLKLASKSFSFHDKKVGQRTSGEAIMRSYEHICDEINKEMEREWTQINEDLQFKLTHKSLCCRVSLGKHFKFFDLTEMTLWFDNLPFQKNIEQDCMKFFMPLPLFQEDFLWTPQITISYQIKRFNEEEIMKDIEALRKSFYAKI